MTAIWHRGGERWELLAPSGFPDEAALHRLVEEAPHMLPLAGAPHLVVLGREVLLGSNRADLVAIESSGRLVVIEIKLARNAEARRAVVAQILTYAAFLRGATGGEVERDILGTHLRDRNYGSLSEAVSANDQEGSFDPAVFEAGLNQGLELGHFRLVLVLDQAPAELIRLVGYLEAVTAGLVIDLVTVASYNVAGSPVIVPQRVDPERTPARAAITVADPVARPRGQLTEGAGEFMKSIETATIDQRDALNRVVAWGQSLEKEGLVKLATYSGIADRWTLLPRLRAEDAGLVTIWNNRGAYLQFWRSIFERRAPRTLQRIEELIAPAVVSQGNTLRDIDERLFELLTDAYREANGKLPPPKA